MVEVVIDLYRELVLALGKSVGYIEGKGNISALVSPDALSIYIHSAYLVNSTKMQNNASLIKALRQSEKSPVRKRLSEHLNAEPGRLALGTEGNGYFITVLARKILGKIKIPFAVKIQVAISHKLWARIITVRKIAVFG